MGIKVRAINPGVYGLYREPGHEFEISSEKHFSKKWMEKVDAEESEPVAPAKGKGGKAKGKAEKSEESEPVAPAEDEVI